MKHWLFILTTIAVGSTTVVLDGDHWLAIVPNTCAEFQPTVPPPVSTGPFTMRVSTDTFSDCWTIPYVNPNGTCGASTWVPCQ